MKTYTFRVSLVGLEQTWRKIELLSDQTLEDLHFAIQDAFEWDAAHLYSFFMSGQPWDDASEYSLPDDVDPTDPWFDQEEEQEDGDRDWEEEGFSVRGEQELEVDDEDEEQGLRAPQSMEEMLAQLSSDDDLRAQVSQMMTEQFGIPPFMVNMALDNADALLSMMPDALAMAAQRSTGEKGDVRTATLESLDLDVGKAFLYLFDYGEEWEFQVQVVDMDEDADPAAEYPRVIEQVGDAPEQYPEDEDWDDEDWDEQDDDWDEEY